MANEHNITAGDPSATSGDDAKLDAALASVAMMEHGEDAGSADAAWNRFQSKLGARDESREEGRAGPSETRLRPSAKREARTSVWRRIKAPSTRLGWFAAAQTAALAAMAFVLIPQGGPSQTDEYRTLSSDDPALVASASGDAVLLFDDAVPFAKINDTLNLVGAKIVDGPMANGGYVIAVEEGELQAAVEELRAAQGVVLVETLTPEEQP